MKRSNRFLKPVDSWIGASGSVDRRGTPARRLVFGERVILSRRHCHFECIAAPAGRSDSRAVKAAQLAARARSPFRDPGIRLVWSNNRVGIWSWPKDLLVPLEGAEFEVVPETLLDAPGDGEVLLRRADGYEGQIWQDRVLVASRWWADKPDARQWSQFLRAVPNLPEDAPSFASAPGDVDVSRWLQKVSDLAAAMRARDYAALVLVLLAVPFLYLGGHWVRASLTANALERELATLNEASADVVAARARALTAAGDLRNYSELLETPHPAAALAVFAEAASGFEATLESFTVRAGRMEIELSGNSDLPLASLVESLEASPVLQDVRLESSNRVDRWRIFAAFQTEGGA